MTDRDKINQLESEITVLKRQVEFISKRFGLLPDTTELEQAIELMMTTRDTEPLDTYLKRGGKIPTNCHCETSLGRRGNLNNGASA